MTYFVQIDDLVREATPDEIERIEADKKEAQEREQAALEAEQNRNNAIAKLSALGLTEKEIAALIGA